MTCLTSLHDPSDLLRLAAIVKQKGASDPPGYDSARRCRRENAEELRGPLRDPTCGDILASSKQPFIRTAATQWLVEMNDSRMGVVPHASSGCVLFIEMRWCGGWVTGSQHIACSAATCVSRG
jgi:hypothetical protein